MHKGYARTESTLKLASDPLWAEAFDQVSVQGITQLPSSRFFVTFTFLCTFPRPRSLARINFLLFHSLIVLPFDCSDFLLSLVESAARILFANDDDRKEGISGSQGTLKTVGLWSFDMHGRYAICESHTPLDDCTKRCRFAMTMIYCEPNYNYHVIPDNIPRCSDCHGLAS